MFRYYSIYLYCMQFVYNIVRNLICTQLVYIVIVCTTDKTKHSLYAILYYTVHTCTLCTCCSSGESPETNINAQLQAGSISLDLQACTSASACRTAHQCRCCPPARAGARLASARVNTHDVHQRPGGKGSTIYWNTVMVIECIAIIIEWL